MLGKLDKKLDDPRGALWSRATSDGLLLAHGRIPANTKLDR